MLKVIMGISAVVAAFLVVTRFVVTIPGLPVIEDQNLIGIVLGLVLVFLVCGAIVTTPADSGAGYTGRLQRVVAALFLLACIAALAALAIWFLHYFGPEDVRKRFSF